MIGRNVFLIDCVKQTDTGYGQFRKIPLYNSPEFGNCTAISKVLGSFRDSCALP